MKLIAGVGITVLVALGLWNIAFQLDRPWIVGLYHVDQGVNVRSSPSTQTRVLTEARPGEQLILGFRADRMWAPVYIRQRVVVGYVYLNPSRLHLERLILTPVGRSTFRDTAIISGLLLGGFGLILILRSRYHRGRSLRPADNLAGHFQQRFSGTGLPIVTAKESWSTSRNGNYSPQRSSYTSVRRANEERGAAYERYVGVWFEKQGFTVEYRGIAKGKKDGGIDLVCRSNSQLLLIQCKCYSEEKFLGPDKIRNLSGAVASYSYDNFEDNGPVLGLLVTSAKLGSDAKREASKLGINYRESFTFPV